MEEEYMEIEIKLHIVSLLKATRYLFTKTVVAAIPILNLIILFSFANISLLCFDKTSFSSPILRTSSIIFLAIQIKTYIYEHTYMKLL